MSKLGAIRPFSGLMQANLDFGAAQHCNLLHSKHRSGVSLAEIDNGEFVPHGSRTFEKAMEFCWLVDEQLNHYMTFNGVKPYSDRCVESVTHLNGHFVDLDFYNHNLSFNDVVTSATGICKELNLPKPTKIIHSGRGCYLLWLFKKPVYVGAKLDQQDKAKRMAAWQLTQNLLINSFESLGADQACKDASRILRISGSVNSKSDTRVTMYDCGDEVSLSSFQSKIKNAPVRKETYQHKSATTTTTTQKAKGSPGKLATLMWARMNDLKALAAMRGGKLADNREMSIFYYALSVSMVSGTTESLLRSVSSFMRDCIICDAKYDPNNPEKLLKSVINRHLKKESARAEKGDFYNIQYRARNETIIANLSITEEEQRQLSTIIGKEEKKRRNTKAKSVKRRNDGAVERSEYEANSLSTNKPWEAMGMSRAKWYRMGKPTQCELDF